MVMVTRNMVVCRSHGCGKCFRYYPDMERLVVVIDDDDKAAIELLYIVIDACPNGAIEVKVE